MKKTFYFTFLFCLLILFSGCLHKHEYEKTIVLPTCESQGFTEYLCNCGDKYIDDIIDKLEHKYSKNVVDSTCTEKGYTEYLCECGDKYIDDETDVLNHEFSEWKIIKDSTETEKGLQERFCNNCNYKETSEIELKPVVKKEPDEPINFNGEYLVKELNGVYVSGKEALASFYHRTKRGEKLRIDFYFHYSSGSERKFYIIFDGEYYITNYKALTSDSEESKFKYLNYSRTDGKKSHILETESYCLSNDITMTYEKIDESFYYSHIPGIYDSFQVFRYYHFIDLLFTDTKVHDIIYNDRIYEINRYNKDTARQMVDELSWSKNKSENYGNNEFDLIFRMKRKIMCDRNNILIGNEGEYIEVEYLFDLTKNIAVMRYIDDNSLENQIYAIVTDSVKDKLDELFDVYQSKDFDSTIGEMIASWGEYVYKKNDVEICFELNKNLKGKLVVKNTSISEEISDIDISPNGYLEIKTNRGKNLYYFDIDNGCYLFVTSKSNPSEEFEKYCRPGMYFKWIGYPYSEK